MKSLKAKFFSFVFFILSVNSVFILTACKTQEHLYWQSISIDEAEIYSSDCKKIDFEGEKFIQYSFYSNDKSPLRINNKSIKNLGYDVCGFEGKLKYVSGAVKEFGFIFNVNLDTNSYYMVCFTPNGTMDIYFYDGETVDLIPVIENISYNVNGFIKDSVNSVKVVTLENGSVKISVNGKEAYVISNPKTNYGTFGIFQMLSAPVLNSEYNATKPMVTLYQFTKLQRY